MPRREYTPNWNEMCIRDRYYALALRQLLEGGLLLEGAWIIAEHPEQMSLQAPGYAVDRVRRYGKTAVTLLKKESSAT